MAIGTAVQKGMSVCIYDERGRQLGSVFVGGKPPDGLVGFTGSTVSVRKRSSVCTYTLAA